ncbi:GFA family protein [Methylomonas sp. MO1]|uniref:GFA family protein n=1 Tax=Methylomonas sp. MO1 TaxID=3073619 RepID=UPI0028A3B26D|nr:GFA family protein [Methylomonas sp. MO1]MDT4291712.1 GFA family protein [Methylomonas sp. MO1]
MNEFIGSCMCGAVQYAVKSEPRLSFLCQCRQCQRITGTGHSAEFMASEKDIYISGDLKFYELTADNGNTVTSGFCPTCGNPVLKKSSGYPGMLFFHAATLDNPTVFMPQAVFWGVSHQPWDYVNPNLEIKEYA